MDQKDLLNLLLSGHSLGRSDASRIAFKIINDELEKSVLSAILVLMSSRNITYQEILGFRDAFIEAAKLIDLSEWDPMDVCGTGGDGKSTFNISTASAFLLAASGVPVAKHGNYAVSSKVGSSNIVEAMGYKFKTDPDELKKEIDQTSICFLHAPLFHPAMKTAAPVRKELGVKTIFNMLGPLLNPARVKYQMCGVYDLDVFRIYENVLNEISDGYSVVHSIDGHDEISLTSPCYISNNSVSSYLEPGVFSYREVDFSRVSHAAIKAPEDINDSVSLMENFLKGEAPEQLEEVILANASIAYCIKNKSTTLFDARNILSECLRSGKAYKNTLKLLELQR